MGWDAAAMLGEQQDEMHEAVLLLQKTAAISADTFGEGGEAAYLMMQGIRDFVDLGAAQHEGKPINAAKLRRALAMATEEGGKVLLGLVFTLAECYAGNTPRKVKKSEKENVGTLCVMYSLWAQKHCQGLQDAMGELEV